MLDHFENVFALKLLRSVFQAIGQNRYDHLGGTFRFRRFVEPFSDRVDGATDCIQERRSSARDITVTTEPRHTLNWHAIVSDDVLVIEQYEGQASFPWQFLLLLAGSRKTGIDKTAYVLFALKHQFQADGLLPPDPPFPTTSAPAAPSAPAEKPAKDSPEPRSKFLPE